MVRIEWHYRARKEWESLSNEEKLKLRHILQSISAGKPLARKHIKKLREQGLFELRVKTVAGICRATGARNKGVFYVVSIFRKKSKSIPRRHIDLSRRRLNEILKQ